MNKPRLAPALDGCAVLPPMNDGATTTSRPATVTNDTAESAANPSGRNSGDRWRRMNNFVDITAGTITRAELLCWLVLFRDERDGTARTSQADIARRSGLGERTVRHAIKQLERRGLLTVVYRGGIARGVSRYRLESVAK